MKAHVGLERLEHESYAAHHQDGILDLLVGLSLLGMALCILTDNAGMGGIVPVLAIVLYPGMKKLVTQPRLGYVKFAPVREEQLRKHKWQLTCLSIVFLILGISMSLAYSGDSDWHVWIRGLGAIPVGIVLATALAAFGILYDVRRGLIYAVIVLLVFVLGHLMHLHLSMQLLALAVILVTAAAVLLFRFIRRYPRPTQEPPYEA